MQSIAVIADIHSNGLALEMALTDAKRRGVKRFFLLGDYITDGPDTDSIFSAIGDVDAVMIRGNREDYMLDYADGKHPNWEGRLQYAPLLWTFGYLSAQTRDYMRTLPHTLAIEVEGKAVRLSHGSPDQVNQLIFPRKDEAVLCDIASRWPQHIFLFGHSHQAWSRRQQGIGFFNPGSLGLPTRGGRAFSYGILHVGVKHFKWEPVLLPYEYDEVYKYYQRNGYLEATGIWGRLLMDTLRDGGLHCHRFIQFASELAKQEGEDPASVSDACWQHAATLWYAGARNRFL